MINGASPPPQFNNGCRVAPRGRCTIFAPDLQRELDVRFTGKKYPRISEAPIRKQGKVTVQFAIFKNGKATGMKLFANSGDVASIWRLERRRRFELASAAAQ